MSRISYGVIVQVDLVDFRARRHHRADRPVAEPHDACDHFPLAGLEHSGAFRLAHQMMDLILRNLLLGRAAPPEQGQNELAREVEQHHQRQ